MILKHSNLSANGNCARANCIALSHKLVSCEEDYFFGVFATCGKGYKEGETEIVGCCRRSRISRNGDPAIDECGDAIVPRKFGDVPDDWGGW